MSLSSIIVFASASPFCKFCRTLERGYPLQTRALLLLLEVTGFPSESEEPEAERSRANLSHLWGRRRLTISC